MATTSLPHLHDTAGTAGDELVAVLTVRGLDALFHLAAHRVDARFESGDAVACLFEVVLEREHTLHTGERHAVVGQLLDAAEQRDVALRVAPAATTRAGGREQALALVDAQRLR